MHPNLGRRKLLVRAAAALRGLRAHRRHRMLGHQERAGQVGAHHALPVLTRELRDRHGAAHSNHERLDPIHRGQRPARRLERGVIGADRVRARPVVAVRNL